MSETREIIEDIEDPKSLSKTSPTEESGASASGAILAAAEEINERIGRRRWLICALLFFAATVNYIDRQVIGILKPTLQTEIGWTEIEYSWIVFAFQTAYAIGLLFVGGLIDKIGTRKGSALSMTIWSVAAMAHAAASSVMGFAAARFALGLGEAGYFPGAIKTVSEWFPKKERALATGIFNAGTNVGALATPLIVPWLADTYGWQEAFIVTGAIGFIWLIFWLLIYRRPEDDKKLSAAELAYIRSDPPESTVKVPWATLLKYKQTWAFAIGKFLTDPIWWVYLFWLPDFLNKKHGLDLKSFGIPVAIIYIIADVGSVGGGYISSALIKRGWTINRGRKTAMLICALAVTPIVFASVSSNLWVAVLLIGLAAAAHQGWSANIFTLTSDMFPRRAVGSVVGIGGMAGSVGGMLISLIVGQILERTGSYVLIFIIAGTTYLLALLIIHLLVPKLEPANIDNL